jgi:hypothetical protein
VGEIGLLGASSCISSVLSFSLKAGWAIAFFAATPRGKKDKDMAKIRRAEARWVNARVSYQSSNIVRDEEAFKANFDLTMTAPDSKHVDRTKVSILVSENHIYMFW